MLARSWGGMNGGPSPIERGRGQGISSTVVHRCRVERGVQSISRKSVCTARSPNAATLSSYSFDRNPLGLCTQSLMALFKDRYRSMETKSPEPPPPPPPPLRRKEEYFHASNGRENGRKLGGSFRDGERERSRERALNRLRDNRRRVARRRIYAPFGPDWREIEMAAAAANT